MSLAIDVAVRAVPPILTAAAGRAYPVMRQRIRTRRVRHFWRPFFDAKRLRVVIGSHDGFDGYEASGLVGVGDVNALKDLQEIFFENGIGRVETVHSKTMVPDVLKGINLVLLGGPDANWATRLVASRVPGSLRFGNPSIHEIAISDSTDGEKYIPTVERNGEQIDYGLIKRIRNPFDETRQMLVMAGSFGFGTWASVRLTREKSFLKNPLIASGEPFECLFRVEVIGGQPLTAEVIKIR